MILGTPPDLHGRSQGSRRSRSLRAGVSLGEVTIGVGAVDNRVPSASGQVIGTTPVDQEWDGLRLASVEAAWSQPINGTTNMQDFPEVAATSPTSTAYFGPREGSPAHPMDLSTADAIVMRLWAYVHAVRAPDFVPAAPVGHLFDLTISGFYVLNVSDTDMLWEHQGSQPDWAVPTAQFRGYMDLNGRGIHDYCLANNLAPAFTLSRDFTNADWSPWLSPGDVLHDNLIIDWYTAHSFPAVDGRTVGFPVILAGQSHGSR